MSFIRKLDQGRGSQNWVFIHGWGSDYQLWQPLRQQLSARVGGRHVLVDLPGFGDDEITHSKALTWQEYLSLLIQELPNQSIVIGWSLGGMLATQLAVQAPQKVRALITLATNPSFVQRKDWPYAMTAETLHGFQGQFNARPIKTWGRFCALQAQGASEPKPLLQTLKAQKAPNEASVQHWGQGLSWLEDIDNRQALRQVTQPNLHLLGEGDALVPDDVLDCLLENSDRKELCTAVLIKGAGHCLHLSQTTAVAERILNWLQSANNEDQLERIDKRKIAESFGKAAERYDSAARLQEQVAHALVDRVQALGLDCSRLLDLACGTGYVSEFSQQRKLPVTDLTLLDLAMPMLQQARGKISIENSFQGVCADAESLPFEQSSFSSILSSLGIQWCYDLPALASETYRVLSEGGCIAVATLCEGTLTELKQAWAQVNDYVHVNPFHSSQEVTLAFESAGFELVDLHAYQKQMSYSGLMPILRDLKTIGAHNMNPGQNPGLTSRKQFRALEGAYEEFRDADDQLPVTYEVLQVVFRKFSVRS